MTKPTKRFIPDGVDLITATIDKVVPDENKVLLEGGQELPYDYLIIATGTTPRPDETPGMEDDLRDNVHEFYTFEGATALGEKLKTWEGGKLVVQICEMPIKCPVAPLEFTFLADAFFEEKGMRDKVDITYVTPLEGAFTKPVASKHLGDMLETRHIALEPDFMIESVDAEEKQDRLLRRARDPLRPAGDHPGEHGRRLHREVRARRRPELRAGRPAHAAVQGARQHLRRSATPPTSPRRRPGPSPTSRWTCSRRTSWSTSRACR